MRPATTRCGHAAEPGYLFVGTYGRSGSTLVTGLLNTISGALSPVTPAAP